MKTGRSSFRELFGDLTRVEIPVIQRDYAQGRDDEHSYEVRRRFLEALRESLLTERADVAPLDLDFVYGRWEANARTLEPLDGQQRLTTLFLLHWYIASVDGEFDDFRSWMTLPTGNSCFTYRTRPAAREFFDALVQQPAPIDRLGAHPNALSDWVTDSIWFVSSWRRDPTVRGSLTMFDDIHKRFKPSKGLWRRLVSTDSPAIIFRLLLLENFNLSDDLYVKMNARGKALTRFEVFKAELERFVGEAFGHEACPRSPALTWREYVSRQFDIAWTDFLWKHRGSGTEVDSRFMHLIRALALVRCVNGSDDTRIAAQVEKLLATPEPGLPLFEELGCLDRTFVEDLVRCLDTLSDFDKAPCFLGAATYLDELDLFQRVLLARAANQEGGLTLVDWAKLYAWIAFILDFWKDLESESVRTWFNDWIRVVVNLAHNSDIDRSDRLVAALRGLRQLSSRWGPEFISQIADGALEESGGFNQQQQREERVKAKVILRNAAWRPLVERAETHPYFRGDIEFLLRFSGVFERSEKSNRCDWSDEEDAALQQTFRGWYDRACAIFPEGAKKWPAPYPEFLLERALLAMGNYLLPARRNVSLLDDKDRDASWKRLLRADTRAYDRDAKRDVVRRVLERVDPIDAVGSLKAIIAEGIQGEDTLPTPGFRQRLVADPRLLEYCQQRMLRVEDGSVFLLARTQRNGRHVDLYIYDLYLHLVDRKAELAPFARVCLKDVAVVYPPSQVLLRAGGSGPTLAIEKSGASMLMHLRWSESPAEFASQLKDWAVDEKAVLHRRTTPDTVEADILELASIIQKLDSDRPSSELFESR